jgi:predicted transcriptional regulator
MPTTTIRLSEELQARIAAVAAREGITSHRFILEAIAERTACAEQRDAFFAEAQARAQRVAESGNSLVWEDVRDYLRARASGTPMATPNPRAHEQ